MIYSDSYLDKDKIILSLCCYIPVWLYSVWAVVCYYEMDSDCIELYKKEHQDIWNCVTIEIYIFLSITSIAVGFTLLLIGLNMLYRRLPCLRAQQIAPQQVVQYAEQQIVQIVPQQVVQVSN